ncbi:MAG TPA: copper-binding protein [Phycisphaerales bacterium]|nr:copper-binding protein [Phycisphaerales bacterium]
MRGIVTELPDPATRKGFRVRHEAIDTFKNARGETVGMGAMTMHFPLAPGVALEGVEVGDVVELTFEVWSRPRIRYHVTRVVRLPKETKLEFREARPPADASRPESAPARPAPPG